MKEKKLYLSLNEFLRNKFGEKVKKIPLDAGLTCPNRDGSKGHGGCIYCDVKGSGTGLFEQGLSLKDQVFHFLDLFKKRGFKKFIAYFQSFSNTYGPVDALEKIYEVVFLDPSIVGLAIGTRPDCITPEVINLLKKYVNLGYFLWVELGLQSIHDQTLIYINRGHLYKDFLNAYHLLRKENIPVVVHIIFGLPGETEEMMLETVRVLASLKIDGVKFHALYIPKGSKIAEFYLKGEYKPLELEGYVSLVAKALTYLPSETIIHRLCSEAKKEDILAPLWVTQKSMVIDQIQRYMRENHLYQGMNYPEK